MGRTVISAAHGGALETVVDGETGWLAAPSDAEAWASAMAKAIDVGRDRRAAMGKAAMARARRLYRAEAMCAATLNAYERVLEARA
jgi:glycosyltransferase involved in cell wall biosynthesis